MSNEPLGHAIDAGARPPALPDWTFLSNHAHVLICLAADPRMLLREVAVRVGITERAVHKIVADLESEGLLTRQRVGRRNHYQLHLDQPLRHPLEAHRSVRELIELVARDASSDASAVGSGARGQARADRDER